MFVGAAMSTRIVTVQPDETAAVAVARMNEANVGSVAVCQGSRLVGIFTERDVLRLAGTSTKLDEVTVEAVMTTRPVTVAPDDRILDAARLMSERRIRHLPVCEGENLVGIVGIRDVLGMLVERAWSEHDTDARDTAQALLQRSPGSG